MMNTTPPIGSRNDRLSSREAAAYLGIRPQTLENWRCQRRNPIPYLKVGAKVQYRLADLDAFLDRATVTPVAAAE